MTFGQKLRHFVSGRFRSWSFQTWKVLFQEHVTKGRSALQITSTTLTVPTAACTIAQKHVEMTELVMMEEETQQQQQQHSQEWQPSEQVVSCDMMLSDNNSSDTNSHNNNWDNSLTSPHSSFSSFPSVSVSFSPSSFSSPPPQFPWFASQPATTQTMANITVFV